MASFPRQVEKISARKCALTSATCVPQLLWVTGKEKLIVWRQFQFTELWPRSCCEKKSNPRGLCCPAKSIWSRPWKKTKKFEISQVRTHLCYKYGQFVASVSVLQFRVQNKRKITFTRSFLIF